MHVYIGRMTDKSYLYLELLVVPEQLVHLVLYQRR
jgi:hypothetical protein